MRRNTVLFTSCAGFALFVLGLVGPGGATGTARASDITFAVIGPHEYDLPVDYKPFNAVVQYGYGNAASKKYNGAGNRTPMGNTHSWSALTKYVYFWTFKALPKIGFAYEIIQGENFTLASGKNWGGLGGTISGPASWFKPTKNSTFGVQTFFQTPSGTRQALATNYWMAITTFMGDWEGKNFSFGGDLGAAPPSTQHIRGQDSIHPGTPFFANLRGGWKMTKRIEPFISFDWQNTTGSYDNTLHRSRHDSSNEIAPGIGSMFTLFDSFSVTARYSHSAVAHRTAETNAYYMKLAYLW